MSIVGNITTSKQERIANQGKAEALLAVKKLIEANAGKAYSDWSDHDKYLMRIATNKLEYNPTGSIGENAIALIKLINFRGYEFVIQNYVYETVTTDGSIYDYDTYYSLKEQYDQILKELNELQKQIESDKGDINNLQDEQLYLMGQIEDTVSDANDDSKITLASTASTQQSSSTNYYFGGKVTYNSEDKATGNLRYWGGNFDSTLADLATGGNHILNSSANYETTDGTIKDISFNHGSNTATDNTKEHVISASDMTATNMDNLNVNKTIGANTLNVKTTGNYNYTAWGEWSMTGGLYTDINGGTGTEQMAMHNNWVAGMSTPDLPTTGSATYSGSVNGHWYQGSVGDSYGGKITGTMNMTVDFANTNVVAGQLNLQKVGGGAFATATMDQMTIDRANSGFAGRLIGADIRAGDSIPSNVISGQFNGPNAEEVGGNWNVTNTSGEFASGVFAGKR